MYDLEKKFKLLLNISPSLIFINGKSCCGKSTLSKKFAEHGYRVIETDEIIRKLARKFRMKAKDAFGFNVYRNQGNRKMINMFIREVRYHIHKNCNKKLVIEGGLSDSTLINNVFRDINYTFIFLNPVSTERYYKRIYKRFIADVENKSRLMPIWGKDIWELIDKHGYKSKEVKQFIKKKAKEYKETSDKKLEYLRKDEFNLFIINV